MDSPSGTLSNPITPDQATLAFHEYQMVSEDTAKITDRRQIVNTLFVSINALFLTGVGYLYYQFFQMKNGDFLSILFVPGFLSIAIITTQLNRTWLRLSEQNRKLINLRIRYLEQLEILLRGSNRFPEVKITLKDYETIPTGLKNVSTDPKKREINARGTYSIEEVLYDPNAKKEPFSFSKGEQLIGRTFNWAYWLAFAISIIAIAIQVIVNIAGFHGTFGPYSF